MMQIQTEVAGQLNRSQHHTSEDQKELRKACADFEAIFTSIFLKAARRSVSQGGVFGNSNESKIYNSILDEKMAGQSALGSGMGLGEMLYQQLTAQDAAQPDND